MSSGKPNGRDHRGQFTEGNAGGPGNPNAAAVARFRQLLLGAVTEADVLEVVAVLVERAKAGERWAVVELLDRTIGRVGRAHDQADDDGGPAAFTVTMPEARERVV